MRKEDVDDFALRRPFEPFEIRLADGQRFRITRMEQVIVGRTALATLSRKGAIVTINMGLISTLLPLKNNGK